MHLCEQAYMHVCAPVWGSLRNHMHVVDSCRPPLVPDRIDRGRIAQSNLDCTVTEREDSLRILPLCSVALNSQTLSHSQAGVLGNQSSFWTCQQAPQPPSHHPSPQSFIFSCYSRADGKTLEESTHCSRGLWNRFGVMEFFIKKLKS